MKHFMRTFALGHGGAMRYSQRDHYFSRHGLTMWATDDLSEFEGFARDSAIDSVKLWLAQSARRQTTATSRRSANSNAIAVL